MCWPYLPQNYLPNSQLPVLGKLAEHVFCNRLTIFRANRNTIIPEQYGCRPKHSTYTSFFVLKCTSIRLHKSDAHIHLIFSAACSIHNTSTLRGISTRVPKVGPTLFTAVCVLRQQYRRCPRPTHIPLCDCVCLLWYACILMFFFLIGIPVT